MRDEAGEQAIKRSIVQILDADGVAAGCGLFVGDRRIITCAHVVADATSSSHTRTDPPSSPVEVVFPYSTAKKTWRASVSVWCPCIENATDDTPADIAVLMLESAPPRDATSYPMTRSSNYSGRSFLAHGFPSADGYGVWVDGTFKGAQTDGWVQLLSRDATDLQFECGFSGAGVWDASLEGFAGIIVGGRDRGKNLKPVAYMIPTTQVLRAWEALPFIDRSVATPGTGMGWPRPPVIVHRYTLLDAQRGLIGRQACLAKLREWQGSDDGATVLTLHAIGGSGKSALAWTWFHQAFANNIDVKGGLWYSFYEPGASFGDFLKRLYSYVEEGNSNVTPGRELGEQQFGSLFEALKHNKLLVVLDGFERLLRAYRSERGVAPDDATHNAELTSRRERYLCIADDENVNRFLTALAQPMASRFLITSRLVPAATLNAAGGSRNNTSVYELEALEPDDVVAMMSAYEVSGSPEKIMKFSRKFGNHALLVKLIAAIVANTLEHARSFDSWIAGNPDFDPISLNITESRVHVLQCALALLGPLEHRVLLHVAAMRGAIAYSELVELLDEFRDRDKRKALEDALKTLHQLTLIEWDNSLGRNHFDLHPLVRNTVWHRAPSSERTAVDKRLVAEFEAFPSAGTAATSTNNQLALSAFSAFIRLEMFDKAWEFAETRFLTSQKSYDDISLLLELMQSFLTADEWPRLSSRFARSECLLNLAKAHELACDLDRALQFYERHRPLCRSPTCMLHQALIMKDTGQIAASWRVFDEVLAHVSLAGAAEEEILTLGALARHQMLADEEWLSVGRRVASLFRKMTRTERWGPRKWLVWTSSALAQHRVDLGDALASRKLLALAKLELRMCRQRGHSLHIPSAVLRVARAEEKNGDLARAHATVTEAIDLLSRAGRAADVAIAQIDLASINLKLGNNSDAELLLNSATETVVRANLRGDLGRIRELQARLALASGDRDVARDRALEAYRIAWGDGPPLSYQSLLRRTTSLLRELDCEPPQNLRSQSDIPKRRRFLLGNADQPPSSRVGKVNAAWEASSPAEAERLLFVPNDRLGSSEVERTIERARTVLAEGRAIEGLQWSQRAVALDPEGHDCWDVLARCSFHIGELEAAVEHYSAAMARSPAGFRREAYRSERGVVLATLRRSSDALSDFEDAADSVGSDVDRVLAAKAYALAIAGMAAESEAAFKRSFEASPHGIWNDFFRGRALLHSGDPAAATAAFRHVVKNAGPDIPPWMRAEAEQNVAR